MNLEIDAILATVKNEHQLSYDEIKEIREHKLYKFYEFYLDISKNIANLKYALEELKDAKYVEYKDIVLGDFIYYIRDKYFYDVDLRFGGYVINKVNGKLVIKSGSAQTPIVPSGASSKALTTSTTFIFISVGACTL